MNVITPFLQDVYYTIPETYRSIVSVLGLAILITAYAILTWKFYKLLAHKDILKLNLFKYHQSEHPIASKLFGLLLYIIEYIIILPFVVFIWFTVLALIIFFIRDSSTPTITLQFAAAIIAAIRILAYHKEEIAEEIAKLLPLAILVVAVSEGEMPVIERIISAASKFPEFMSSIVVYFLFIAGLEFLMRIIEIMTGSND